MTLAVQHSFADIERMAEAIAQSGLFGLKNSQQALGLMLLCQAEGLHPAVAARDYHIISGKPALKADAMLARFQSAGGRVEWRKYADDEVSAVFSHPAGGSVEISWSLEQAKRAGLTGKDTWKQYPRQMLRARVISEGIRTVYPGVLVGTYTPEEVADFDTPVVQPATAIEAQVVEAAPAKPKPNGAAKAANKHLEALGIEDKSIRQALVGAILGRTLGSAAEVTADEWPHVAERLEQVVQVCARSGGHAPEFMPMFLAEYLSPDSALYDLAIPEALDMWLHSIEAA